MTPIHLVRGYFAWQNRAAWYLFGAVPKATLFSVTALIVAQLAQLFSLFIPLKVILILGSDGFTNYLPSFIGFESKSAAAGAFSLAAVGLYILSIILAIVSNRVMARGGIALLELRGFSEQTAKDVRRALRKAYVALCHTYADLTVFFFGCLGLLFLNAPILISIIAIMVFELVFTHGVMQSKAGGFLKWLRCAVANNPAGYLKYLSSANFLCVFALLLVDYLVRGKINTVTAILTLLLGRRMFQSMSHFSKRAVMLYSAEQHIKDMLIISR